MTKRIITAVVLLLIVAITAACAPINPPTNPLPVETEVTYLSNDGARLTNDSGRAIEVVIKIGGSKRFDITAPPEAGAYTLKIVPNTNAPATFDFYTSSGQLKNFWQHGGNLTKGFDVEIKADYFVIATPISGVPGILERVYGSVTIVGEVPATYLFAAVVTFENGTILVIEFAVSIEVAEVIVDPNEVVI